MKKLEEVLQSTGDIAKQLEKKIKTCSGGSEMNAGITNMKLQPDQVLAVLSQLRLILPEQINTTSKAKNSDKKFLEILELTKIRADHNEVIYWLGRLFLHFPQRNSEKDGVIISDISGACIEHGVSLVAVAAIYNEIWQESTKDNPWLPSSGEILNRIIAKTDYYRNLKQKITKPVKSYPRIEKKYESQDIFCGRKWKDFTKADHIVFSTKYYQLLSGIRPIWRIIYEIPDGVEVKKVN